MASVCVRHRTALIAGLRALWSEIAAREGAALAPVRACLTLADPLPAIAEAAGYPTLAGLLRALVTGWSDATAEARLGVDASIDLAAWCDTLVIGLEEGLDADAIDLLCTLHDGGTDPVALAAALVVELDLARVAAATTAETPPPADADPLASPALEAARQHLTAQGIDLEGLSDQELLDLAEALSAAEPAAPAVDAAPEVLVVAEPVGPDPVAQARQLLGAQGVELEGLSDQDLLDLAEALGAAEPAVPVDAAPEVLIVAEPVGPDPVAQARQLLGAQGVELEGLSDQDLLDLAEALGTAEFTLPEAGTQTATEPFGSIAEASLDEGTTADQVWADAPATPAAAADATLWIAEEELALTCAAITEQVMPGVMRLVDAADADAAAEIRQELGYQLGLIANALQLFGIETLNALLQATAEATLHARIDGEGLIRVSAALLGFLDRAEPEAAAFLAREAHEAGLVDAAFLSDFATEVARIRIGLDPALIAARKRQVEPGDLDLRPAADVLPDVLSSMLRELPGNAERLGRALRALVERRDTGPMDEARRVAHTLKGDANTVGVRGLANLTHALEDSLIELLKAPERLSPSLGAFLLEAADLVEECADHLLGRGPAPTTLGPLYQQALDWSNRLYEGLDTAADAPATPVPDLAPPADAVSTDSEAADATPTLAVDTRLLEELQRLAGELTILARQMDQRVEGLLAVERELRTELTAGRALTAQLDDLVALRGVALQSTALTAHAEVDALELDQYNELHTVSRRLSETHSDNEELLRRYGRLLRDLEPLRAEQQRLNDDLQRTVARTRTLPFADIGARLQRVARQTARQVGKSVDVRIAGETTPIDAELLERLVEPLSHLLRNAIDHGIEIPELRRAAGKPDRGTLQIAARIEADRAVIEVADDGRGLDLRAIRAKAIQRAMISADAHLSDDALAALILAPGFSTRDTVSQVSGRGVGLDVVNQRIQELRGSLAIHSEPGRGTRFALRLPLSRRLANVVVVEGHGVALAVVASAIRRIVLIRAEDLRPDPVGGLEVELEGQRYPAQPIETLFDRGERLSLPGEQAALGLLVDLPGGRAQVLCARSVGEITRAVVKPTSPLLPPIPAVRGITQLGDGRPAPVVDLDVLLDRQRLAPVWSAPSGPGTALPRVVVADDSLSVRRALEQLMQDAGYDVAAARDGLEALQLIQQRPPVAVLLDLEMPRMNGLEVCRSLRTEPATRETPVVMITSRASDKYRLMAEEAGVTRLLGKPFSEDELVTLVRDLVAASETLSI